MNMKRIVIIGGGFAGLNLAKRLSNKSEHQIILVDRNNYHFFPPLLYQVGTAFIESSNISYPFRKMFHGKNIRFFMGELQRISPEEKKVFTDNGSLEYDILVLAMGTETNFFGNRQIEKYALPMKTIGDALELRNHVLLQLEKSVRSSSIVDRVRHSNIVIAGGGPTGVELAGMLAEMGRHIIGKDYPEADVWPGKIFLVDGLNTLLAPMSKKSQEEAIAVLKKLGVAIMLGKLVEGYNGEKVSLSDGTEIFSSTLIWASGVVAKKADGIPQTSLGKGRRILVDGFNRVHNLQDVYAIGDQCLLTADPAFAGGHPQLAQVAIQQGNNLGKNLNKAANQNWDAFKYRDKGSMAIISKFEAVVDLPKGFFSGFFAWLVWLFIHIIPIAGFRNKAKLAFNWLWSFLTNDPTLRLIVRPGSK
jgi:NADH dehydrogenase